MSGSTSGGPRMVLLCLLELKLLYRYHEWIIVRVVDTVLENIRLGLEIGMHPKYNQQRLIALVSRKTGVSNRIKLIQNAKNCNRRARQDHAATWHSYG